MKIITLLALVLTLSACSVSDSKKEEVAVNHDDLEFAVDTLADAPNNTEFKVEEQKVAETVIPDEYQAPPVAEETAMTMPEEPKMGDFKAPDQQVDRFLAESHDEKPVEVPTEIKITPQPEVSSYGPMETYHVQKGDTMMMVAFKIYGDYRKWKDLKEWNKDVKKVKEGVVLQYQVPESKFGWMPNGTPYLIKTGDTLQIISMDKYGTTRKWKSIYKNNRPLIRDPNLIFAGFTIYYQPERDLASEKK